MSQSVCVPKFSPLNGLDFEILTKLWYRAECRAQGVNWGLRPQQSMAHGSIWLRAKIQPSRCSGFWDISRCHVCDGKTHGRVSHQAQVANWGLWPQQSIAHVSICLRAKFQPSRWYGFQDISRCHACDGRTDARVDARTHTLTAGIIYIEDFTHVQRTTLAKFFYDMHA